MVETRSEQASQLLAAKRAALLKHFGSVEGIKNATVEQLVEIKGINSSLAEKLLVQLGGQNMIATTQE